VGDPRRSVAGIDPSSAVKLTDPDCDLFLSAASLWKSLIKSGLGKLPLPMPAATFLLTQMAANGVNLLPISGEHLVELEILP